MPDADPTPPPVPPDAPRLLSVEEVEEGAERWERYEATRGWTTGLDAAIKAAAEWTAWADCNADRLLAAARLAATLQAHQEQAVVVRGGEVVGVVMSEIDAEIDGRHHDPGVKWGCCIVPLPVEDEEEPK